MTMERRWNDTERAKLKYLEKNTSQCHFFQHEFRILWPDNEPRPLCEMAANQLPGAWQTSDLYVLEIRYMAQLTPRYDTQETTDTYVTRSGEKSLPYCHQLSFMLQSKSRNITEREVGAKRDSKDTDSSLYTEITTRHRH